MIEVRGRLISLAFAGAVLGLSAPALGYTTISTPPSRWMMDWAVVEIPWVLNSAGCPDMSNEQTQAALEASFQSWEDVDCATIGFTYGGETDQDSTGNDGVFLMVWRGPDAGWPYGSGALGVTGTWFGMGVISDADIEFNSVHYNWSETGTGGTIDLQSVATHEIGHFLGLGHSDQMDSVMFPTYSGGTDSRFLSPDDRAGVCFLYPSASGGCTTNDECPLGHVCDGGDCIPSGEGNVCDLCGSHEDCGGPSDSCVRYPDGVSRCGRACREDADCATAPGCGARTCLCQEMSGGGQRQCAPADLDCVEGPECENDDQCPDGMVCQDQECVPRGCSELGNPCETRGDCCSGMCLDGLCSQGCDWLNPGGSCPSGFYCSIQECGVGACVAGSLGATGRGGSCVAHEGCRTGYCGSTGGPTECQIPCDPDGVNTCPGDDECVRIGASRCGLCACHIGRLGDPCFDSNVCASGLCATKSGDRRCSRFCSGGNPCPEGYDCLDAGVRHICWPALAALGEPCEGGEQCASGTCARGQCSRPCETDCHCPVGYDCAVVDEAQVCVESEGDRGCECRMASPAAGGQAAGALAIFGLAALLLLLRRRW